MTTCKTQRKTALIFIRHGVVRRFGPARKRRVSMSSAWEIFRHAWEHGFNVGYLQGYIPFIFTLNRYYYFSSNGIELEDVYRKLADEGFFDWYLDRNVLWKREENKENE